MKISAQVKSEVNRYLINRIHHKNGIGYIYFKRLLECVVELYYTTGTLPLIKISKLRELAEIETKYQSLNMSIKTFFKNEGIKNDISSTLISMTEEIVSRNLLEFRGDGF